MQILIFTELPSEARDFQTACLTLSGKKAEWSSDMYDHNLAFSTTYTAFENYVCPSRKKLNTIVLFGGVGALD